MNSLNIIGRLTRDPETKYTSSGTAIASFAVALDIGWGDNKKTAFVDCSLFGKRAESLAQYAKKGNRIALSGSLDYQEWEKNGEKKSKYCMKVDDFTLIEKKSDNDPPQPQSRSVKPAPRNVQEAFPDGPDGDEDDIPF